MLEAGFGRLVPPHHFSGFEDHFEMRLLANIRDVYHSSCLPVNYSMPNCRHVSSIIVIASIRFNHHRRHWKALAKDALSSFV